MSSSSPTSPVRPRLKMTLRPAAEAAVRSGHPWVYADSIRRQNREGLAGEEAVIYDRRDRFLAIGFYDPASPLRVRVFYCGSPETIDEGWWAARFDRALARRTGVADESTNGLRLIHGESDGWPGLVLDRYDRTLVVKVYSPVWLPRLEGLVELMKSRLDPERVVLRTSRNLPVGVPADGTVLVGSPPEGPVVFRETGLSFEAEVIRGQKTGFFLDQRDNRRRVEGLSRGRDVLNAFSFSGGFSLYAARGGARSVTDLDLSAHALESAKRNFRLNPALASCRHESVQADAFAWLGAAPPSRYDLVVVDPPSLAKREAERSRAIAAYGQLNGNALRLLRPGGLLVAASCSAHVGEGEFFEVVRAAAVRSGRRFTELERTSHAPDHPADFPEARYLKCLYLRLD